MIIKQLLTIIIFIFFASFVYAQGANSNDVIINEIAWMGTITSASDEWIELFNTTDSFISFQGWTLKTADEKIKISLEGGINAKDFYLLERTDDNSVLGIGADMIYKGSLSNDGQWLKIYDSSNNLIDQANFLQTWTNGNSATKQTTERTAIGWQTSKNIDGTPKKENSTGAIIEKTTPPAQEKGITPQEKEIPILVNPKIYPTNIVFSELMPAPKGADDQYEWIELKNNNSFDVDLAGWTLNDTEGATATYTFKEPSIISAQGYMVLWRPETKITLNNDTDSLELLSPDKKIVATATYQGAKSDISYSLVQSEWQWSTTSTPGKSNVLTRSTPAKALPKPKKSDIKTTVATASVVGAIEKTFSNPLNQDTANNPWLLFFIALGITISSGALVLAIKLFTFKKTNERSQSL